MSDKSTEESQNSNQSQQKMITNESDSSEQSTSSDKQEPIQINEDLQLKLKIRKAVQLLGSDELFQPKNETEKQLLEKYTSQNTLLQRRAQAFNRTDFDEFPAGLLEFTQVLTQRPLRCNNCTGFFSSPHSFQKCGHTFCAHCLIEKLHNYNQIESNKESQIQIPEIKKLNNFQTTCPVCAVQSIVYYNLPLHQSVCAYVQANPHEVIGTNPFVPEKINCCLCQKQIIFEKQLKKHADDEDDYTALTFSTDFCVYCRRYFCSECRNSSIYNKYCFETGCCKEIVKYTPDEVHAILKDIQYDLLSAVNPTELQFLFQQFSIQQVWDQFCKQLDKYYYLPIKLYSSSQMYVDKQHLVCQRCLNHIFDVACQYIRSQLRNNKPICLCGSGCYQQFYSKQHQEQCQHYGKGTRGEQSNTIWG